VNRTPISAIEGKRDEKGGNITTYERQTDRTLLLAFKPKRHTMPCHFCFKLHQRLLDSLTNKILKLDINIQRKLTDLLSLIRFAAGFDTEFLLFSEEVDKRFQK